jgi:hypothetical protein
MPSVRRGATTKSTRGCRIVSTQDAQPIRGPRARRHSARLVHRDRHRRYAGNPCTRCAAADPREPCCRALLGLTCFRIVFPSPHPPARPVQAESLSAQRSAAALMLPLSSPVLRPRANGAGRAFEGSAKLLNKRMPVLSSKINQIRELCLSVPFRMVVAQQQCCAALRDVIPSVG